MNLDPQFFYRLVRVAAVAFLATFTTFELGILNAPDWGTAKSLAIGALSAAATAAYHAVLQTLTKGQAPVPGAGVLPPPN